MPEPIHIPLKLLLVDIHGNASLNTLRATAACFGGVPVPVDPAHFVAIFDLLNVLRSSAKDKHSAEVELAHDLAEQVYNAALGAYPPAS